MIIVAIISLIAAVVINYFNNLRDALNGHINHTRAWKIKALTCTPSVVLFTIYWTGWPLEWPTALNGVWRAVLFSGTWFMFLFNAAWGIKVSGDPFYRSTAVGKNLPWSDKIFLHWPKWLYILFMCALVTGATLIYFYANR